MHDLLARALLKKTALSETPMGSLHRCDRRSPGPIMVILSGADRPVGQGGFHDNRSVVVNFNCVVLESLVSTRARRDRHDGDLLASICVDAVHRTVEPETGNDACGTAVDILSADYLANLVLAAPGLSRRQVRPAAPDLGRCADGRRRLGSLRLCRQHLGALSHLWRHQRIWHRHHLCRHHWSDGALVSGPARAGDRACRRGLWVWCHLHQLPDRQHDQERGLCAHTRRVGYHPGRDRHHCCAMAAYSAGGLATRKLYARDSRNSDAIEEELYAGGDVEEPDLLAAVLDDEHDVDQRADGRLQRRTVREGIQRRRRAGARNGGAAALADPVAFHQRPDAAVLWLGVRSYRPRADHGAGILARVRRYTRLVCVYRPACLVRGADGPRVVRLGRDLLAVSVDPDRHLWTEIRRDELRLPLYRPRRRLDPGWPRRRLCQAVDGQLDGGFYHRGRPRCGDCASCHHAVTPTAQPPSAGRLKR